MIDLDGKVEALRECEKCQDIQIKKFSPLKDLIDFDVLDGNVEKDPSIL